MHSYIKAFNQKAVTEAFFFFFFFFFLKNDKSFHIFFGFHLRNETHTQKTLDGVPRLYIIFSFQNPVGQCQKEVRIFLNKHAELNFLTL